MKLSSSNPWDFIVEQLSSIVPTSNAARKQLGQLFYTGAISLLLLMCFTPMGCDKSEPSLSRSASGKSTEDIKIETVAVDRLNRTVYFTKVPQRIVSLSPSTTELLFAIGAGHQLVGATEHCNYPPAAANLTRVGGGTLQGISRETILSLSPDLILCKWDSHQPLIEPFDRFKVPIMAVCPDTLSELYEEATLLGRVTGHVSEASELVENMKRRVVALTWWVDSVPMDQRRRAFYEVWDEPLMTAGPKSFIGEMLEMGGMKNIFSDATVRYPRISDEVVLDRDPEVILAPSTHRAQVSMEILAKRQGWDRITAVRERQVFLIDGDQVSRCGPRMLDALEEMIRAVYPEKLPKVSTCTIQISLELTEPEALADFPRRGSASASGSMDCIGKFKFNRTGRKVLSNKQPDKKADRVGVSGEDTNR